LYCDGWGRCIDRYPEWLELLPADGAHLLLRPLANPSSRGFGGQLARLSVHLEELLLPKGDEALLERPKIANYVASYRLPGQRDRVVANMQHAFAGNDAQRIESQYVCLGFRVQAVHGLGFRQ
jgi:hypothetical protein